jgi:hypothetical protein
MIITFDAKEGDPKMIHDQAYRFCVKVKDIGYDIEVAELLHMFIKACGVTQEELDTIQKIK